MTDITNNEKINENKTLESNNKTIGSGENTITIKPVNKKKKDKLYNSYKEINAPLGEKTITEKSETLKNNALLESAIEEFRIKPNKPSIILSSTIAGTYKYTYNGKEELCAILYFADSQIIIPKSLLLRNQNINTDINRRFNSICEFVIEDIIENEDELIYIGNSVKAQNIRIEEVWQNAKRRNKYKYDNINEHLELIHEDKVLPANIVEIVKNGVIVSVSGLETLIPFHEISYNRINYQNINKLIEVGKSINIKILSINNREDINAISYTASIKQVNENPRLKQLKQLCIGATYTGVISGYIKKYKKYIVTLNNGFEVTVNIPIMKSFIPKKTRVSVKITKISEDKVRAYGNIVYVNN